MTNTDLVATLTRMNKDKRFGKLVFYLEACESGSYFGYYWYKNWQSAEFAKETLQAQFEYIHKTTNQTGVMEPIQHEQHAQQWGPTPFAQSNIAELSKPACNPVNTRELPVRMLEKNIEESADLHEKIRLFDANPTYIEWFPKFVGELKGNAEVIRVGVEDLEFVSTLIDTAMGLSWDENRKMLRKQHSCHKRRKVTQVMFEQMMQALMGELNDKLGPDVMTRDTQATYDKFLKIYSTALYSA
ncbi:unnamed protein product [Medioppia subpectinata]|uniref:Globin domain-containing protein n=1 Tax=Medioppia subpectinata TaxID=1979941 RepID=A0A7R9Q6D3_9ACAR|nr:unnamed protein product [Medioppia subpectinata]CAG2114408.1 unnamed protein product [Medioppia subpectinata]